ncbi:MAG: hypothetical protein J6A08_03855 [Lachnospiraceae bacterium]|nr:hypothetical protein [Lachnospiraceae bacterium]
MICCLAVYYIGDVCLTKALSADDGMIQEALSVPSQQFGRIYTVACANGDEESKELIEAYYTEMTTERYNPHLSDPMKGHLVNVESAAKVLEYFRTAGKLLVKYPLVSLDSFLYLTEGGWYINDTSCAAIYGTGLETRQGYLLTDVKDRFGTIEFGIVHQSRFPLLENILEHAFSNNEYQKIPILSVLFAPALYFWILAFCMVGLYYVRNVRYLYLTGFLGILYLTVLAGPCIIVRYMYPFIVCSPVLLAMLVKSVRVCYMNKEYIDGEEV